MKHLLYEFKIGREKVDGFLIQKSKELILIFEIRDLRPYGFIAAKNDGKVRIERYTKQHVLSRGLAIKKFKPPKLKQLASFRDILAYLNNRQKLPLVEYGPNKDGSIFLGTIDDVQEKKFTGRYLATNGKLLKPESIRYSAIKQISWDNSYLDVMSIIAEESK